VAKALHGRFETKASQEKMLSIKLLGPPEVSIEGRLLRFGTKKSLALLCYLAAEGRRCPRSELAKLLWPQSDERHARIIKILIQFTSNSHLHPLYCPQQPPK
jgi:two-component SAPR family response regulator